MGLVKGKAQPYTYRQPASEDNAAPSASPVGISDEMVLK
jgi:hypothetical protein